MPTFYNKKYLCSPYVVVYTFDPSILEIEVSGSVWVQSSLGLHIATLSWIEIYIYTTTIQGNDE